MMQNPVGKNEHIECMVSNTDYFTPAFVQADALHHQLILIPSFIYSAEGKGTQLVIAMSYKDTTEHLKINWSPQENVEKPCLIARHKFCQESKTDSLCARAHADIFSQEQLASHELSLKLSHC